MSNGASLKELSQVQVRAGIPGPLIDIPELLHYRDLLWTLAKRNLRVRYKRAALGVMLSLVRHSGY